MSVVQDLSTTADLIVVIVGPDHLETRSWRCNNKLEAEMLAQWLSDNRIANIIVNENAWNEMNHQ